MENYEQIKFNLEDRVYDQPVEQIIHDAMLPYAEHVIMDRAIPRVEDGLKPVQRRILYSMYEMGLTPDKPYRKSASIVGDCLGKYHPHGDSSVYDALVRMAQSFVMSIKLIDGHGNFGSIDGDSAAAMRYTEARMSDVTAEMLRDIDKNTVNWKNNYDDRLKEPETLPSRFPNILVNGANGIAVGVSTNILPHNIGEVIDGTIALIDKKNITVDEIMQYIKGPDFPTGGIILGTEGIKQAYLTGKGKVVISAKMHVENESGEKRNIVITEIPYKVNKAALLRSIAALKELNKYPCLSSIIDVVDESDRNGMRAVIKLKRDADLNEIVAILKKETQLVFSDTINMVAIAGGKPKLMGIIEMLSYYVEYQRCLIVKRSKYDLEAAQIKAEINEGLIIAINNIDEVVRIIKTSGSTTEAKANLRKTFSLTERQATAILDMRLARLVKLEIEKLEKELAELKKTIAHLRSIIANKKLQYDVLKDELKAIKKTYRQHRRTELVENPDSAKFDISDDESRTGRLCIMSNGYLKFTAPRSFDTAMKSDNLSNVYDLSARSLEFSTDEKVLVFTNKGNLCQVTFRYAEFKKWNYRGDKFNEVVSDLPDDELPVSLMKMPKDDERSDKLYFYTKQGMVKKITLDNVLTKNEVASVISLSDGDEVVNVERVKDGALIYFMTAGGYALLARTESIPEQKRGSAGVKGIKLKPDDYVISAMQVHNDGYILCVSDTGFAKRYLVGVLSSAERYGVGDKYYPVGKFAGKMVGGFFVSGNEKLGIVLSDGSVTVVNVESVKIKTGSSSGDRIVEDGEVVKSLIIG